MLDIATQPVGIDQINRDTRTILQALKRRRFRSMSEFATHEIIIPTGQYEGRKLDLNRQPFLRHLYDCIDSGEYSEFVVLGPSQSGKSLSSFVVPILYHLFEIQETVIAAVPIQDMIADKWHETLKPAIERTRYRDLLPDEPRGSRKSIPSKITFKNGVTLRWMTAGGGDKSRSHYTARVICFTETDGFDETATTSDEGTKISQIEARARSFPAARRRIYKECTVSHEDKHTWDKYENDSTTSRLLLKCHACGEYVLPEREHLLGWKHAATKEDARDTGLFVCPECVEPWSEDHRRRANRFENSRLVHAGQTVTPDGVVHGDSPRNRTLGFRWTAVHNQFLPAGDHAADEWAAPRGKQPDLDERKLRQFVWAIPITDDVETFTLDADKVAKRMATDGLTKGVIPQESTVTGIGVDVGKRLLHFSVFSDVGEDYHVSDYGRIEVPSDDMAVNKALQIAFGNLKDLLDSGLSQPYDQVVVDVRYLPDEVLAAIRSLNDSDRWIGHLGFGDNHWTMRGKKYLHPTAQNQSKAVRHVGRRYHTKRREKGKREVVINSDACYFKGAVQRGFSIEPGNGEAITLFTSTNPNEHIGFGKHMAAEREEIEYEPGKGHTKKWVTLSRSNHFLDATYMAYLARIYSQEKPKKVVVKRRPAVRRG